jgi:hypothetical protein
MVQNPQAMDANPLPTVICVLRSGGIYGAGDVEKLRNQVARHLSLPHEFVCLSDVEVSCKRIALQHDWSGWWSKVELFRPGVIQGPTVYMDLDNVILGDSSVGKRGIMTEAFGLMVEEIKTRYPGRVVSALVLANNPAVQWYLKRGFLIETDNGDHFKMVWRGWP